MTHLFKLARHPPFQWVFPICSQNHLTPSKPPTFIKWAFRIPAKNRNFPSKSRCFHSVTAPHSKLASITKWASHILPRDQSLPSRINWVPRVCRYGTANVSKPASRSARVVYQAQAALMDYLNGTSGLEFSDAEHLSQNSPTFLEKILEKVEKEVVEEEVEREVLRFLRYHPPNEFELLFESMGLEYSEFSLFLPRDLMYLKDDEELLDNYHVLCNYGFNRAKIGRIYKEAAEVFKYKYGVLETKLHGYEQLGLSKYSVIKIVVSSPRLLVGDVSKEFLKVIEELEGIGIKREWLGGTLSGKEFYNWGWMPLVLRCCMEMGFEKKELGKMIRKRPDFMLDGSGKTLITIVGFLLKVGTSRKNIYELLTRFPRVQVGRFLKNMQKGLSFLAEIQMDPEGVKLLLGSHTELFGAHTLKQTKSLLNQLNVGKKRLCRMLKEDPQKLKKYVKGSKVCPLPNSGDDERSLIRKREFLLQLGFVDGSKEMQRALREFRGKGDELQGRYDFLTKCGIDSNDVYGMIKVAPNILNQKVDVLESKINFLVKDMGFPLCSLVGFPYCLAYTVERVKLRFLMYNWLKDKGKAAPNLALSSLLACSEKIFRKRYINSHPDGPKMWEHFKVEVQVD